jgi:transcriptional regulator with XRE-family HTH domain
MPVSAHDNQSPALPVTLPATDRQGLGALLCDARRALGMTQRQLELASGVPQGKISRIERGQSYPAVVTLTQLAGAMGLELTFSVSAVAGSPVPSARTRSST